MTQLTIIGNGNMGQAITGVAHKGGHQVQVLDVDDAGTPVTGEIVVLALPYPAVRQVIAERSEQLAGRVVVDITNPLDFETFDSLVVPVGSSAAAEIAAAWPRLGIDLTFPLLLVRSFGSVGACTGLLRPPRIP